MDSNLTLSELIKELQRFEDVCGNNKVVSICYCNDDIDGLDPSFLVDIFDGYRFVTIHIPKIKRR